MSDLKSIERCAGDYPIVWEFTYTDRVQHRTATAGGMDSEFSHWEEGVAFTAHIVAITEPLARAAFHHLFTPLQGTEHAAHCHKKIVSVKPLLVINGFAKIGRGVA
jgi:hypothetical protein